MSITAALNTALFSRLASGGTVTNAGSACYWMSAPDNATLPYVVWSYINEHEDNDHRYRSKDVPVFIRAYAGSKAVASLIDGQIDTALNGNALTVTGWSNFWARREDGKSNEETDNAGKKTYMCGADYRLRFEITHS